MIESFKESQLYLYHVHVVHFPWWTLATADFDLYKNVWIPRQRLYFQGLLINFFSFFIAIY